MRKLIKTVFTVLATTLVFTFPAAVSAHEEPEQMIPASRVMIDEYYVVDGGLIAGKTSTAVFMLRNTGVTASVNSVLITGWIETEAPVEFAGSNQVYVPLIPPGGIVAVEVEYSTKNVDLTSIESISAGFTIAYGDEGTGVERTNSVSLRLPVSGGRNAGVNEEDMHWTEPGDSVLDVLLYSQGMQFVYAAGLVFCCAGVVVLLGGRLAEAIAKRKTAV